MKKNQIPEETKQEVIRIVNSFNTKTFKDDNIKFIPEFKGEFLYLNRMEYDSISPLVRLKYTGDMKEWIFAIFQWSSETYDDEDLFFPGDEHIDGTIEGAMKAGNKAYPAIEINSSFEVYHFIFQGNEKQDSRGNDRQKYITFLSTLSNPTNALCLIF